MSERQIKQFKLTNDDEIICEVLQWDNEESSDMIIRGTLRIINVEDFAKGVRFYAFRPWMIFSEDPESLHTLNSAHIIAETNPSKELLNHYAQSLSEIVKQLKSKRRKKAMSLDDVAAKIDELDEDEFDKYLEAALEDMDDPLDFGGDSDKGSNVVEFKPKNYH